MTDQQRVRQYFGIKSCKWHKRQMHRLNRRAARKNPECGIVKKSIARDIG